jgi:hypothetical protein
MVYGNYFIGYQNGLAYEYLSESIRLYSQNTLLILTTHNMQQTINKIIRSKEYQEFKRLILGYIWGRIKLRVQNFFSEEQGGIIDVVDDRDIKYEDVEVVMGEVPETFGKRSIENIQNQRHSPTFP